MSLAKNTVRGVHAPSARPTALGALWLALLIGLPVAIVLWVAEAIWRFVL